jgi:hypothetical protein
VLKLLIFEEDEICTTHISVLADRISEWHFTAGIIQSMRNYYCRAVEIFDNGQMQKHGNNRN